MRSNIFASRPLLAAIHFLFALGTVAGCSGKKDPAASLPPASGSGAAPKPELPVVQKSQARAAPAAAADTTGTTYAWTEAQLGPKMSGVLAQMNVAEGDQVKKGQVLFRLDTADLNLRVSQARTGLKAAQVQLASVQLEYDRLGRLFDKNAIDRAQWERVQNQLEGARTGVEQAKLGVSIASQYLNDASIRSPVDGVVVAKLKSVGETVTMMPPTVVVVVQVVSRLELRFRVPETELGAVKAGDAVTAVFQAGARQAKVLRVQPTVDARTRTVEIVAELDNADGALRPGMLAKVERPRAEATGTASDMAGAGTANPDAGAKTAVAPAVAPTPTPPSAPAPAPAQNPVAGSPRPAAKAAGGAP